jgi:hypothetical protein
MERKPRQKFKGGYIIPSDSSDVENEFRWSDHIEEYSERKEYIERTYNFGNGTKRYYWILVNYKDDGRQYAIACRKYTFEEVENISNNCQCNSCTASFVRSLFNYVIGYNSCPCCKGCLKEGFESEYDINEHIMKKTLAFIQ